MNEYHKIQSLFKRNRSDNRLIVGDWTTPEFEYLAYNRWVFTEKVDGTNIRIMFDGDDISFGGKTNNAQIPANLIDRLRKRFPNNSVFSNVFDDDCSICLYGEGYGAGIQSGGTYRQDQDFVLFDVKVGDWWLSRDDVEDVARNMALDVVPVVGRGSLWECIRQVQVGFESSWGKFMAEGIVARPATELVGRGGKRIIAKIKHSDFKEKAE